MRIYANASTKTSLFLLAQLMLHRVINVIVFPNCQYSTMNNVIKDSHSSVLDKIEHDFSAMYDPLSYCQKIPSKKIKLKLKLRKKVHRSPKRVKSSIFKLENNTVQLLDNLVKYVQTTYCYK